MDHRKLPPASAPNDHPEDIVGNLTLEHKQDAVNILAYNVADHPGSRVFGHDVAKGLVLTEAWVKPVSMGSGGDTLGALNTETASERKDAVQGLTVCEIVVEGGMLNVHGGLAGSCAVLLIDIATFSSLFVLSLVTGTNAWGVSTTMSISWHGVARSGVKLRLVSTSLSLGRRASAARCEVYDATTAKLLISAVHTIAPLKTPPSGSAKSAEGPKSKL